MRTWLSFLFANFLFCSIPAACWVRITGLERSGMLVWTNTLCTTAPVYRVWRATGITGSWQHVAYVTNQHSFFLTNPIPSGSSAFYQIAWVDDDPVVLDYAFDEHGIGELSVVGTLTLRLPSSASWFFEETEFNTSNHPLGAGFGPVYTRANGQTVVRLRQYLDDGIYFEGNLQANGTSSRCAYTFTGIVYWINFGGTDPIGAFVTQQR